MKEKLLHFIWQHRRFDQYKLATICGEKITIIHPGFINHHDGPDFLNAKVKIGNDIWNGSVEIHVDGRDWYQHKHHFDPNYSNVILHVVYSNSKVTCNIGGHTIPTLELNGLIPLNLIEKHDILETNSSIIACSNHIQDVDEFIVRAWKERLVVERLEEKVLCFQSTIDKNLGDWETSFFQIIAINFGLHANKEGFEALAKSIDHKILLKHKTDLFQLEALLFGQSGLLDRSFKDEYPNRLKKEYQFLKKKYRLNPISKGYWMFKGLRPISFPTIRIAQLADLIHKHHTLFSAFQDCKSSVELLKKTTVSEYWQTHYTFDAVSREIKKVIGNTFANLIVINAYIPMLFAYGNAMSIPDLSLYAMELLSSLSPEINRKTKLWKSLGIKSEDASDSQALIQAINNYCLEKRCLECPIGCHVLKGENHFPPPKKFEEPMYIYN